MARFAILRHDTPDGWHWDMLLERPGMTIEHRCLTFRLDPDADPSRDLETVAARLGDHRAAYLDHEGALPPGPDGEDRGRVRRHLVGELMGWGETPDSVACELLVGGGRTGRIVATCNPGEAWRLCLRWAVGTGKWADRGAPGV